MYLNRTDIRDSIIHPFKTLGHIIYHVSYRMKNGAIGPCPNCNHTVSVPPNGRIYVIPCAWCNCLLQYAPGPDQEITAYERDDGDFGDLIGKTEPMERL